MRIVEAIGKHLATTLSTSRMEPLLVLSIILLGGLAGGWAARRLRVPSITGNILAGVALGYTILHGVSAAVLLHPLSLFAIGLIAVTAGGHFSYRRIHNTLFRIFSVAFLEVAGAFTCVYFAAVQLLHLPWQAALILGALSVETAPATTVAVVNETRSKGPFVKTLLSVVSLDASLCIMLFAFARSLVAGYQTAAAGGGFVLGDAVAQTLYQLVGSLAVGLLAGVGIEQAVKRPGAHHFSTVSIGILLAVGVSLQVGLSSMLTCLFLGMYLGNTSLESERQLRTLEPLEPMVYTIFFTLAGVSIHLDTLAKAGLLCVGYIVARSAGKALGAMLGGLISNSSRRIWSNLPFAFVPHAGVAIGLVVVLEGDQRVPADMSALIGTVVLAAVTVSELIGPILTRLALRRAKEVGLDRPRLMEFLQEEFILTGLEAEDKWDALRQLTDFFLRVHHINPRVRDTLYNTVIERERSMSTAIGRGAAIPHGRIESGPGVQGVMGISPKGVDFGSPDGAPVHIIMLIVTPKEHEEHHLKVLASLARMISNDAIRKRLIAAINANDAWEVIESEESRGYNYFLREESEETPAAH